MYTLRNPSKCEFCGQYGEQFSVCSHCGAPIGKSKEVEQFDSYNVRLSLIDYEFKKYPVCSTSGEDYLYYCST